MNKPLVGGYLLRFIPYRLSRWSPLFKKVQKQTVSLTKSSLPRVNRVEPTAGADCSTKAPAEARLQVPNIFFTADSMQLGG